MSCNSWMGYTTTVHGHEHDEALRAWAGKAAQYSEDAEGNMTAFLEWDSAGWMQDAISDLEDSLSELKVPLKAWSCHVRYEYYDEPSSDGSFIEFDVVKGKVANHKESRVVMVDCEPDFKFEIEEEGQAMADWSMKEQEIVELVRSQDDEALEELRRMTKAEIENGNESLSFAFDQICREKARRTVEAIKNL